MDILHRSVCEEYAKETRKEAAWRRRSAERIFSASNAFCQSPDAAAKPRQKSQARRRTSRTSRLNIELRTPCKCLSQVVTFVFLTDASSSKTVCLAASASAWMTRASACRQRLSRRRERAPLTHFTAPATTACCCAMALFTIRSCEQPCASECQARRHRSDI